MAAPAVLDVFNSDLFTAQSLTAAINVQPYVPMRLGSLGIFEPVPIATTSAIIERIDGTISIVPDTPRGAPANPIQKEKRVGRTVRVPHFPVESQIMADEVQNVRAFGSTALESVENIRNRRLLSMANRLDATIEYGRIGAIKGVIYDSDGTTELLDLFTLFGISQTQVDFVLGTAGTSILQKCMDVLNPMEDALAGMVHTQARVLCGKTFWKKFISHAEVKDAYKYFQKTAAGADPLTQDLRYKGFEFGGLVWEQYRGNIGNVAYVPDTKAYAFPVVGQGANLYQTVFAPADYTEAANTLGLPRYAKAELMRMGKGLDLEAQSNPLSYCTMPEVLIELITSN